MYDASFLPLFLVTWLLCFVVCCLAAWILGAPASLENAYLSPSNLVRNLFNHVGTRSARSNLKMEAENCNETLLLLGQSTWPIMVIYRGDPNVENCHRPDTNLYVAVGKAAQ
jgi:hypothetical protein